MKVEKGKVRAPEIGRVWLNSTPLSFRQLRGRAVLVDFWDYTCVNCIRTLPYVQAWHERYRDKGLTVIGVHTPEFTFAQYESNVERGIREFGLTYPIVIDSDREIWKAFANRYWPTRYLLDQGGYLRYGHFGEGGYGECEQVIQELLREIDPDLNLPAFMEPVREADQAGAICYRASVAGGSATKVDSRKIRLPTTFSPESRKKISSTPVDAGHRPPSTSRLPKPGRIFCA
jgi:thiol-disulfide isomerase/thioredoxin